MAKTSNITTKKRPFKIWSRGKRFQVSFKNIFRYIPDQPLTLNYFSSSSFFASPIRFRRIVVRSLQHGYVSGNSIEAFRKVMAPYFRKRESKIYKFLIRCYPFLVLTKKPSEVRIGGGKGSKVRGFFCPVRPGQVLFEVFVRNPETTKSLFLYASRKLSVPVKVSFF